jgi:hypothetical protein
LACPPHPAKSRAKAPRSKPNRVIRPLECFRVPGDNFIPAWARQGRPSLDASEQENVTWKGGQWKAVGCGVLHGVVEGLWRRNMLATFSAVPNGTGGGSRTAPTGEGGVRFVVPAMNRWAIVARSLRDAA